MTRFTSIHETTRYEVVIRGVQSRAEAEAIVKAVEALPRASAWIPSDGRANVEACPAPTAASEAPYVPDAQELPPIAFADADDNVGDLLAGQAFAQGDGE